MMRTPSINGSYNKVTNLACNGFLGTSFDFLILEKYIGKSNFIMELKMKIQIPRIPNMEVTVQYGLISYPF
jgi:hypothetical protein